MITVIFLAILAMIALGAVLVYKSMGSKAQATARQTEAQSRSSSTGRATGSGEN